jgi:hypothetical protein
MAEQWREAQPSSSIMFLVLERHARDRSIAEHAVHSPSSGRGRGTKERKARRAIRTHDILKAMMYACTSSLQPHDLMLHDGRLRTSAAACWPTSCLVTKLLIPDSSKFLRVCDLCCISSVVRFLQLIPEQVCYVCHGINQVCNERSGSQSVAACLHAVASDYTPVHLCLSSVHTEASAIAG